MSKGNPEVEVVEVPVCSHAQAEGDAVIMTGGLGPCVGVALYSRRLKRGFMAHLANPANNRRDTDAFFNFVREGMEDETSGLRAWLRGGGPDEPGQPEVPEVSAAADRFCIVSKIGELGLSNVDVSWNDEPSVAVDLCLDCRDGSLITTYAPIVPESG